MAADTSTHTFTLETSFFCSFSLSQKQTLENNLIQISAFHSAGLSKWCLIKSVSGRPAGCSLLSQQPLLSFFSPNQWNWSKLTPWLNSERMVKREDEDLSHKLVFNPDCCTTEEHTQYDEMCFSTTKETIKNAKFRINASSLDLW